MSFPFSSGGRSAWVLALLIVTGCSRESAPDPVADEPGSTAAAPARQSGPAERPGQTSPAAAPRSGQDTLAAAKDAYASKRFDEALRLARAHLVIDSGSSEGLFLAADCLLAMGQEREGFETLALIPVDDAKFGMSAAGRVADWHLGSGRPRQAKQAFEKIVETHGDLPLALSRLALLANAQGQRYEASTHLTKLARLQNITRRELGALITISDQCSVEVVPGTTGREEQPVEGDLRRARQLRMSGKWRQCQQLAEKLHQQFPDSAPIAAFLGTVYADQQLTADLQRWHADLPGGIRQQPEYWTAMAAWMEFEDQTSAAIRCCCESLSRDPSNSLLYDKFAQLLRLAGRESEAEQAALRYAWLSKVLEAYNRTFESDVKAADYVQISEYLLKLRRPWEAVGWRKVAGRTDPASVTGLDPKIEAYFQTPATEEMRWLLCGVDPVDYDLPDVTSISMAENALSQPGQNGQRQVRLVDVAESVGLQFQYDNGNDSTDGSYFVHEMLGGGIGVIDFDRDGFPDLYFSQGGGQAFANNGKTNQLHRNLSGRRFAEVTGPSMSGDLGYGQGVAVADYNQDGFSDLIIANVGRNLVLRNNGDGTFMRVEIEAWSDRDEWTSLVAVGDLSGDGLPELVECNYIDDPAAVDRPCAAQAESCGPADYVPASDRVLRLAADGKFTRWPAASKMEQSPNYSLGAIIANFDDRAGNDLFVANDTGANAFWISSEVDEGSSVPDPHPDGPQELYRLSDEARIRGCATGPRGSLLACMGIATGDFDRDGSIDLFVTNFYNEPANFFLQRSAGLFIDKAGVHGLRDATMPLVGFGAQACDFDRDGNLDIAVLNGHAIDRRHQGEPLEMAPQFFRGTSRSVQLQPLDGEFWQRRALGRALAVLDWNRDGKPDLIAGHVDVPAALLMNESAIGDWIQLDLVGTTSERDAVGAKVTLTAGDRSRVAWITGGDGYHSTNEPGVDFGLGHQQVVDQLTVHWPSGSVQKLGPLETGRRYLIIEGDDLPFAMIPSR